MSRHNLCRAQQLRANRLFFNSLNMPSNSMELGYTFPPTSTTQDENEFDEIDLYTKSTEGAHDPDIKYKERNIHKIDLADLPFTLVPSIFINGSKEVGSFLNNVVTAFKGEANESMQVSIPSANDLLEDTSEKACESARGRVCERTSKINQFGDDDTSIIEHWETPVFKASQKSKTPPITAESISVKVKKMKKGVPHMQSFKRFHERSTTPPMTAESISAKVKKMKKGVPHMQSFKRFHARFHELHDKYDHTEDMTKGENQADAEDIDNIFEKYHESAIDRCKAFPVSRDKPNSVKSENTELISRDDDDLYEMHQTSVANGDVEKQIAITSQAQQNSPLKSVIDICGRLFSPSHKPVSSQRDKKTLSTGISKIKDAACLLESKDYINPKDLKEEMNCSSKRKIKSERCLEIRSNKPPVAYGNIDIGTGTDDKPKIEIAMRLLEGTVDKSPIDNHKEEMVGGANLDIKDGDTSIDIIANRGRGDDKRADKDDSERMDLKDTDYLLESKDNENIEGNLKLERDRTPKTEMCLFENELKNLKSLLDSSIDNQKDVIDLSPKQEIKPTVYLESIANNRPKDNTNVEMDIEKPLRDLKATINTDTTIQDGLTNNELSRLKNKSQSLLTLRRRNSPFTNSQNVSQVNISSQKAHKNKQSNTKMRKSGILKPFNLQPTELARNHKVRQFDASCL